MMRPTIPHDGGGDQIGRNGGEQVIIFEDEDSDNDFEPATAPMRHHYNDHRQRTLSQQTATSPLQNFHPPVSNGQLESFLRDGTDEPMMASGFAQQNTQEMFDPLRPSNSSTPSPSPYSQQRFNTTNARSATAAAAWERFDPLSPQRQSLLDAPENDLKMEHLPPGMAGFLEIETEPSASSYQEPIQTTSGLLLTHRKPSASTSSDTPLPSTPPKYTTKLPSRNYGSSHHSLLNLLKTSRLLVAVTAVLLMAGTAVLVHHSFSSSVDEQVEAEGESQVVLQAEEQETGTVYDTIVLLPLPQTRRRLAHVATPAEPLLQQQPLGLISLRREFDAWLRRHEKQYENRAEQARRFTVWSHNQANTAAKNARHGACRLTGQPVFGANHLADLTTHEFRQRYLQQPARQPMQYGDEARLPDLLQPQPMFTEPSRRRRRLNACKWYDVSCHLRYFFSTYLYGLGGTMEPRYDADSYPTALDWRDYGAVTDVHSQGSCGACWAITATETAESAVFLGTGTLYDLAETEVIMCEGESQMCAGGWPQNAFEYIMEHNGLPLSSDLSYDADLLLMISEQVGGTSDELDSDTVKSYQQQTCPSGGGSGDAAEGSNTYSRYGTIKGYGYSTSKCVCYTDGSGCDCDQQNEGYAVRNLATYGPAVVCLDASTWQDYTEGIITSESGCSQGFMDVNHCVQAVGYAYLDESDEGQGSGSGSGSGSNDNSGSGSKDDSNRNGYWIIRNQWSSYWGMNGYAYVAMGENTCGILNDMLQAYT